MGIPTYKAFGRHGSWFASVNDEILPCIHNYWFKAGVYDDPNCDPKGKKWSDLIDALRTKKRAVVTLDKPKDDGKGFDREGYIAVFSIDDVEVDGTHLRLRLVDRLINLK